MIQRVQTLYLLGSVILFVLMMCFPLGYFNMNVSVSSAFWALGVNIDNVFHHTLTVFCILLIAAISESVTIFLFKKRALQMRLIIFNCVLQLAFYITVVAYILIYNSQFNASFSVSWPIFLPLIAIVLNIFAYRAIFHDESLLRSLNHLR